MCIRTNKNDSKGRSQNLYSMRFKKLECVFNGVKRARIYIQWGQNYKIYDKLLIFVGSKLYLYKLW